MVTAKDFVTTKLKLRGIKHHSAIVLRVTSAQCLVNLVGILDWMKNLQLWLCTIYMGKPVGPGFSKWCAKLRAGKLHPGIAFTICTNQFHSPNNNREGLKVVSKMALKN